MGRIFYYSKHHYRVGVYESSDVIISVLLHQNGKRNIFVVNKKNSPNMKHGREMLLIAGYSLALIIHMVLIMQLAVLLNKSLNII